jgi:hypothetical protein
MAFTARIQVSLGFDLLQNDQDVESLAPPRIGDAAPDHQCRHQSASDVRYGSKADLARSTARSDYLDKPLPSSPST